ncbi:hypothetical protein GQ600_23149 [Phytophthora cactorum]|nr:hypothetical protein GQ600_23149 [Phytophthora cactorum]
MDAAASQGDTETVKWLLGNRSGWNIFTALGKAAKSGHLRAIQCLARTELQSLMLSIDQQSLLLRTLSTFIMSGFFILMVTPLPCVTFWPLTSTRRNSSIAKLRPTHTRDPALKAANSVVATFSNSPDLCQEIVQARTMRRQVPILIQVERWSRERPCHGSNGTGLLEQEGTSATPPESLPPSTEDPALRPWTARSSPSTQTVAVL